MRVIGVISGTSHDAVDAAAVDLDLRGDVVALRLLGARSTPFEHSLRSRISAALPPAATTVEQVCRLDADLGQAFGAAAAEANERLCDGRAELVVSHGQTVFHGVDAGRAYGTLQLGQAAWIAERTGLPVVSDLRARDIARGGQGAPLVSLLDVLLLGSPTLDDAHPQVTGRPRAALNLGGIANVTVVAHDADPLAYDTGPANALLDAAVERLTAGAEHLDRDGARARAGSVVPALLDDLLADPYYRAPPPKSTGKERFNAGYLESVLAHHPGLTAEDVLATLTSLTARTVADACLHHDVGLVVVSGGGTRNPALMDELTDHLPGVRLVPSDDLGIPGEAKEAVAFALLGFCTVHGLRATLPSCTGAAAPSLLGQITPGQGPLRLPAPASRPPRRILVEPV